VRFCCGRGPECAILRGQRRGASKGRARSVTPNPLHLIRDRLEVIALELSGSLVDITRSAGDFINDSGNKVVYDFTLLTGLHWSRRRGGSSAYRDAGGGFAVLQGGLGSPDRDGAADFQDHVRRRAVCACSQVLSSTRCDAGAPTVQGPNPG